MKRKWELRNVKRQGSARDNIDMFEKKDDQSIKISNSEMYAYLCLHMIYLFYINVMI